MNATQSPPYLALSGGVGGARLVLGLTQLLSPEDLTVVTNTGDDFQHLGLTICPDLDTVLYTLAGWNNPETGWGQRDESWNLLNALARLGGEDWFRLGDRDLATHLIRTQMLTEGHSLSEVAAQLSAKMGVKYAILPMTDDPVATVVITKNTSGKDALPSVIPVPPSVIPAKAGTTRLTFQHYFVRDRCQPQVERFEFEGIAAAVPSPGFLAALEVPPSAVIICPSNPFVSVAPVLNLPGIQSRLKATAAPVIAVSPIVGGRAIRGPAAKMMAELGLPQTALGVAQYYVEAYGDLLTGFVLDQEDESLSNEVAALGLATRVTNTVMSDLPAKTKLAAELLDFATSLQPGTLA